MIVLVAALAFVCGVLAGALMTARAYRASQPEPEAPRPVLEVVELPPPPPPAEPAIVVPAPEPIPIPVPVPMPDPIESRYTCVLLDAAGQMESVRRMAYLPPNIQRYHGKKSHKTYRYERVDAEGRHLFQLVSPHGH